MRKIFISYRREDSEDISARIYDRLVEHYGRRNVIFDVDDVPIGVDFRKYLNGQVVQCDALLAVIGRTWLTVTGDDGSLRLGNKRDHLRIEIESAARASKPVVPVLVRQASMPEEDELPETLAFLAFINAARVSSGKDFEAHIQRLIRGLDSLLEASGPERKSESPVSRRRRTKQPSPQKLAEKPTGAGPAEVPSTGPWLLEQVKAAAVDMLPNTTWKLKNGWWSLGSSRGLHLLRAKATRNILRLRIRKNGKRRTRTKANASGWIYSHQQSDVRDHHQLGRAIEMFQREWL